MALEAISTVLEQNPDILKTKMYTILNHTLIMLFVEIIKFNKFSFTHKATR